MIGASSIVRSQRRKVQFYPGGFVLGNGGAALPDRRLSVAAFQAGEDSNLWPDCESIICPK